MGWATQYITKLQAGETVQFRPHGNSMSGKISSGQLVTVSPVVGNVVPGDIVLCKVNGKQFLHIVGAVQGERYRIENNKHHVNGWTTKKNIYGIVIKIEN